MNERHLQIKVLLVWTELVVVNSMVINANWFMSEGYKQAPISAGWYGLINLTTFSGLLPLLLAGSPCPYSWLGGVQPHPSTSYLPSLTCFWKCLPSVCVWSLLQGCSFCIVCDSEYTWWIVSMEICYLLHVLFAIFLASVHSHHLNDWHKHMGSTSRHMYWFQNKIVNMKNKVECKHFRGRVK